MTENSNTTASLRNPTQQAEPTVAAGGREKGSQTLRKGLDLLEHLAECEADRGLSLGEIAQRLGWHKSTVHRLLATLKARGYVEQKPDTDRYRLGLATLRLGGAFTRDLELRTVARQALETLASLIDLTVGLVVLDPDSGQAVYVDFVDGTRPLRVHRYVGSRFPANCTAAGKAILAHTPDAVVQPILRRHLARRTAASIHLAEPFKAELASVRAMGYAVDNEENTEGVRCVAAPVFDFSGAVVGALSVSGAAIHLTPGSFATLGSVVSLHAAAVSSRLGFVPPEAWQAQGRSTAGAELEASGA